MKYLALVLLSFFLLGCGTAFGQHDSAEQKQREEDLREPDRLTLLLAEMRVELSQLLVVYGKNHPAVKKLQSQIDHLRKELDHQKAPERDFRCSQPQCGATLVPIRGQDQQEANMPPPRVERNVLPPFPELQPLVIPPAEPYIYVAGDGVKKTMGVPVKDSGHITVLQALALAQGMKPTASLANAGIIRKTSDGRSEMTRINLKRILEGRAEDFKLNAGDILFVPTIETNRDCSKPCLYDSPVLYDAQPK